MYTNLTFQILLLLFTILAINGVIYSLIIINLNKNYFKNFYIRKNTRNYTLASSLFTVSNIDNITSSDSSASQTLSLTSSESTTSSEIDSILNSVSDSDSDSSVSSVDIEISDDMMEYYTSEDSITVLNRESFEQLVDIMCDLYSYPRTSPATLLQQVKFEELNILYSQDIILYGITPSELRHLIELLPAIKLYQVEINHLILTMMAYFHT